MNNEQTREMRISPQEPADTIDLLALAKALLGQWYLIVLSMLICGAIMGVYNRYMEKTTYSAETQIYITGSDSIISLQEIQLSAALTQDYRTILTSRNVMKKVIADLGLDTDYKELRKLVAVTNPKDTHILSINVTTDDPELSVTIANSLVQIGVDRIFRIVGQELPSVIDYAESDAVTVNRTSLLRHVAQGMLVGAALMCGLLVMRYLLDTTIKDEEDVYKLTHYTVLVAIPEFDKDSNDQEVKSRGNRPRGAASQTA